MNTIAGVRAASYRTYGHRRVQAELVLGQDLRVSHGRVERLMRSTGLQGVHRRRLRGCTRRDQAATLSDDLVERNFRPAAADRPYVADVTQHRTSEGWLALPGGRAGLLQLPGRGVGEGRPHPVRAGRDALQMAVWNRRPEPGAIHHSDHGSTCTSWAFGHQLREAGYWARWAASATAATTRSPRASPRPCRPSCSTARPGPPARVWPGRLRLHRGLVRPATAALRPRPVDRRDWRADRRRQQCLVPPDSSSEVHWTTAVPSVAPSLSGVSTGCASRRARHRIRSATSWSDVSSAPSPALGPTPVGR